MKLRWAMESPSIFCLVTIILVGSVTGQCPWSRELADLHADCICAYNSVQRLSIQCSLVNFTRLLDTLHTSVENIPIDLLYINNSTVEFLAEGSFRSLELQSLHLSRSRISEIHPQAFAGVERSLTSLNLQDNLLKSVPTEALRRLTSLKQLDLAHNHIVNIGDDAFAGMPLTTLKLSDNQVNVSEHAFRQLEGTLKNLNMKGCHLNTVPAAIRKLEMLAFLDLAQNQITRLEPGLMAEMDTLTALNLERNKLIKLDTGAFLGVNDTLSSLSLLNNIMLEFPSEAMTDLGEIRVLDLGFNGIRIIPDKAFVNNPYLTLLALDGNPLSTVPYAAFQHLNSTLRGLSIGGSYLECDCRLRWITDWIRDYDLQVTSRERNPQFCSKPEHLQRRSFFQLTADDLLCDETTTILTSPVPETTAASLTTKGAKRLPDLPERTYSPEIRKPPRITGFAKYTPTPTTRPIETITAAPTTSTTTFSSTYTVPSSSSTVTKQGRSEPSIAIRNTAITVLPASESVKVINALRYDSDIVVEWDTGSTNLLGFQVVYRYFGEREFKRGAPLGQRQRNYTLEGLPPNQCLIICVITLEESSIPVLTVENVPYEQCREVKTERQKTADLDKIVIAASAGVCGVIIVAVIIFICCYRRSKREKPRLHAPVTAAIPIAAQKSEHEWETLSVYSGRSIPRARMYQLDPSGNGSVVNQSFVMDDNRSHISHFSHVPNGYPKARSTADGQSHRSYSQLSNRFNNQNGLHPDMSKSQQSLSQLSYIEPGGGGGGGKKKSKRNGRLTSASSLHSLTEYDSDWNGRNWKDNEVDIYVGQNHVVPTHVGKYRR